MSFMYRKVESKLNPETIAAGYGRMGLRHVLSIITIKYLLSSEVSIELAPFSLKRRRLLYKKSFKRNYERFL